MPTETFGDRTGAENAGCEDASIVSGFPDTNLGSDSFLDGTSLIRFPGLSAIPGGSTIVAAALTLNIDTTTGGSFTVQFNRLIQPWTEGGVTWNDYDGENPWDTAGATGADEDYDSAVSEEWDYPGGFASGDINSNGNAQFLQDIQNIVDGAVANHGWLFDLTGAILAQSSDDATGTVRPLLTVEWTEGGGGEEGSVADDLEFGDTFAGEAAALAATTDALELDDASTAAAAAMASVAEGFGLADTDGALAAAQDALLANLGLAGQTEALSVALAALAEGLELGETWAGAVNSSGQVGAITESTALSEVFLGAVAAYAAISAGVSVSDAWSAKATAIASMDDDTTPGGIAGQVALNEAWASMAAAAAAIAASIGIGDTFAGAINGDNAIAEGFDLTAAISALAGAQGVLIEGLTYADTMAPSAAALASVSFAMGLGATFTATTAADVGLQVVRSVFRVRASKRTYRVSDGNYLN